MLIGYMMFHLFNFVNVILKQFIIYIYLDFLNLSVDHIQHSTSLFFADGVKHPQVSAFSWNFDLNLCWLSPALSAAWANAELQILS